MTVAHPSIISCSFEQSPGVCEDADRCSLLGIGSTALMDLSHSVSASKEGRGVPVDAARARFMTSKCQSRSILETRLATEACDLDLALMFTMALTDDKTKHSNSLAING